MPDVLRESLRQLSDKDLAEMREREIAVYGNAIHAAADSRRRARRLDAEIARRKGNEKQDA